MQNVLAMLNGYLCILDFLFPHTYAHHFPTWLTLAYLSIWGFSLAVQWVGLHTFIAEGVGSALIGELKIRVMLCSWKKKKKKTQYGPHRKSTLDLPAKPLTAPPQVG